MRFPYNLTIPLFHIYSSENEILCSHKNLYVIVYDGLIGNCQRLKTSQMSMNWSIYNQSVVHPYIKILLSTKKEPRTDTCSNKEESLLSPMPQEAIKPEAQGHLDWQLLSEQKLVGVSPYHYRFQISLIFLAWSFLTIFSLLWCFQENIPKSFYWECFICSGRADPDNIGYHVTRNRGRVIVFNNSQRKDLVWVDFRKLDRESGDSFPFREKGCSACATHMSPQKTMSSECWQERLPCRRCIL